MMFRTISHKLETRSGRLQALSDSGTLLQAKVAWVTGTSIVSILPEFLTREWFFS